MKTRVRFHVGKDICRRNEHILITRTRRNDKSKGSSSEDEKVMQRSRPKRSRAEPDRFGYEVPEEPTPEQKTRRRRRNSENRNIDQYSSDDEFVGNRSRRSLRQRVEEPAKSRGDKRRKQISFRSRDTSSSSSSENIDEQSFAKRKNKRY